MEQTEIKRAGLSDLVEVHFLEQACFASPWPIEILYDDICLYEHPYYILRAGGIAAGYAGMSIVLDEAHIRKICVHKDFRRHGFGRMLMQTLMCEAAKCGAEGMTLEVRRSNQGALTFYQSFGFEMAGVRKNYYEYGEDALILWKHGIDKM